MTMKNACLRISAVLLACGAAGFGAAQDSAAPASADALTRVDLSAYVGRYAHDEVNGVTFLDHPVVRAAVEAVVADPSLRQLFLTAAVQSPITLQGSRVVSHGCERHHCSHQWLVSVDQSNGQGEVCHYDPRRGIQTRWYHRGGMEVRDDCPF